VITTFSQQLNAECIIPPPPCRALAQSAMVVVVDVIEAAEPWEIVGGVGKLVPQVVRLRVVERFKGVSPQQQELTGSIHHSAESIFLQAGKRYLLYTENWNGSWLTNCSRTKLADVASAEVRQLRGCAVK
jgi:hypothetical protein